jgi:hypothetical protein
MLSVLSQASAFLFPEWQEGVNAVDNPVPAMPVGVQDLGAAIYPHYGGTTVSDFARNTEGNIVRKTMEILLLREGVLGLCLSQWATRGEPSQVYYLLSSSLRLIPPGSALWANQVIYFV